MVHLLSDKIELGDSDLKIMLKKHHEKRKHQPVRLWWEWPFVMFSLMLRAVLKQWQSLSEIGAAREAT